MSKKILLIAPKDSYLLGSPPLGVGYLISYSNKVGKNEVYFHDENFINENELNSVLTKKINEIKPDFIGITFPSSAIYRVVNILETVKRDFPSIVCFAGGYHPTSEPEATLRVIPDLDFIILDQGEYAFANIDDNWKQLICVGYIDDEGGWKSVV